MISRVGRNKAFVDIIHKFLVVDDFHPFEHLLEVGFRKIRFRVFVNKRVVSGFVLGNGLPDILFLVGLTTFQAGFEAEPAVIEDRFGVCHAIGLPFNFTAPLVDAAFISQHTVGGKRSKARTRAARPHR